MPVRLPLDETDPIALADECARVSGLRPRDYPSIAHVQALLKACEVQLRKKRRGRPPTNINEDLSAGV